MRQTRTGAVAKVSERSEDKSVDRRQPLKRCRKMERWQSGRMRQTRTGAIAKVSERSEDKSVDRRQPLKRRRKIGEVAEWSNAADSKSVDRFIRSGGSNPPLSAIERF